MKVIKRTLLQKECSRCGEMKNNKEYFRGKGSSTFCIKCEEKRQREKHYKSKYGMTISDYDAVLENQNGKCAICEETKDKLLNIDHDHTTGKIRGLLCNSCNTALGLFQDKEEVIKRACLYLGKNK